MNSSLIRPFVALLKKEFYELMTSPLTYVVVALFFLLSGWLFFNYLLLATEVTTATVMTTILSPLLGNIHFLFIFLAPLLTMRLFSVERRDNTLSFLLRSSLKPVHIILAKLLPVSLLVAFMLLLSLSFPLIMSVAGYNNWSQILASYLGLYLSILSYLSVGVLASSLVSNQMIAAMISFFLLLLQMLIIVIGASSSNMLVGTISRYLSIAAHYELFLSGTVLSSSLLFFFSFIAFIIYLTHQVLSSKDW